MDIDERVHSATAAIFAVLQVEPSDEQSHEVSRIIEQAVLNGMLEQTERCSNVAMTCCAADLDLAHKVAERIDLDRVALITNLSSMR